MAQRRPRRTAQALQADIHAAVLGALLEEGYLGITFEGVARRCAVSKPVLYRRYADRSAMVIDALGAAIREEQTAIGPPRVLRSRGSLREDLIARFEVGREWARIVGPATYRGLVGEADLEALEELAGLGAHAASELQDHVVQPARERGELGPDPIPPAILLAPLRMSRDQILFGEPTLEGEALVDEIAIPLYRRVSGAERSP